MILVRPPTPEALQRLADQHNHDLLTYSPAGATLVGPMPPGYILDDEVTVLGQGDAVFTAAREALDRWQVHRGSGIAVSSGAEVAEGAVVALAAPLAPPLPVGSIVAMCRVVDVVDSPERYGFAYGTLPVHPAQGEEAFLIERSDDGSVRFRVLAFSKPQMWLARAAGPLARTMQRKAIARYLRAMEAAVGAGA